MTSKQKTLTGDNIQGKYKGFRSTDWYGGCATADSVGCNLSCCACWSWQSNENPSEYGEYYTPSEVVEELEELDQPLWRISSGEPTIRKAHLLKVLDLSTRPFLLETNGILLDEDYCEELSLFNRLHVRLSFKGYDEESFEEMTTKKGFGRQIEAVKNLRDYNISFHCAIIDLYSEEEIDTLREKLEGLVSDDSLEKTPGVKESSTSYKGLEVQKFVPYPHVKKRMEGRGYDYDR